MKKSVIIGLVVLALVAGGVVFAMNKKDKKPSSTTSTTDTNQAASTTPSNSTTNNTTGSTTSEEATITYSNDGFSPSTLTVKSGTRITIKNTSDHDMQFDSDPHPVHTADTELNVDMVGAGQTATFTVTKKGTFGYHNHLNPNQTGTIVVQ